MKQDIIDRVQKALESLNAGWGVTLPDIEVEIPRDESVGDIAITVAMRLARLLKKPPRKIAEEIVAEITGQQPGFFENVDIAGPGFINFRFKQEYFHKGLQALLEEEHSSLRSDIGKGARIQVEFVSANPTGPLHIGHGRGAAVGSALCNILKAAGYDVQKEFYINDAGLQVKLLGRSVYARYQQLHGNDVPFPEDGYKGDYIADIAKDLQKNDGDLYLKVPFDECGEAVTDHAYKMMLANLESDLKDFGVVFDNWQSEKELHEQGKVEGAINALRAKDLIYDKDGAVWFSSTRFEDDKDRVVKKQDGEYTYFASDICYHKDKLDRGFDTIIDIWGADHHGYIPRIRSVLEAFDLPKEKFRVILIQMVSLLRHGVPVQMSKRAGAFITLREVIDEVGPDITKFIFLTRKADSQLEFDIDVAKEQSAENPVFYVQYAYARISSLFRLAEEKGIGIQNSKFKIQNSEIEGTDLAALIEPEEILLVKKLLQYPMVFEGAALACEPHRITYYLQELAGVFHAYYYKHRIITEDNRLTLARLSLCRGVKIVLDEGLKILGVSAPERM
ncbi:MAG: arginine--tRNA ligase [Nitrospiraceae bacterium]|nr:MAG: arginine--tRNA ligase [Nitrospiraceae bacterium]